MGHLRAIVFIESQNYSGWQEPQKVSSPMSCLKKSQLRESDQFAQDFIQSGFEKLKDGDCITPLNKLLQCSTVLVGGKKTTHLY